jgi:hypothetical protein
MIENLERMEMRAGASRRINLLFGRQNFHRRRCPQPYLTIGNAKPRRRVPSQAKDRQARRGTNQHIEIKGENQPVVTCQTNRRADNQRGQAALLAAWSSLRYSLPAAIIAAGKSGAVSC